MVEANRGDVDDPLLLVESRSLVDKNFTAETRGRNLVVAAVSIVPVRYLVRSKTENIHGISFTKF